MDKSMRNILREFLGRAAVACEFSAAESFNMGYQKQGIWFQDAAVAAREAIEAIRHHEALGWSEEADTALEEALGALPSNLGEPLDRGCISTPNVTWGE